MWFIKSIKQRATSASFQDTFVGGLVAIVVYELVRTLGTRLLPHTPVVVYNVLVTALVVLMILGFAAASWMSLKGLWQLLISKDFRHESWERIRGWPTSKWDVMAIIGITWMIAVGTVLIGFTAMAANSDFRGVVSVEQAQGLWLLSMGPPLIIGLVMILRGNILLYKDFRQRLATGTRRQQVVLCSGMSLVLAAVFATAIGEFAGWSHLLWFYSN